MTRLAVLALIAAATPAAAQQEFTATLAGHAQLPAETTVQPPQDAPDYFAMSGRFTGEGRATEAGAVEIEATGLSLPIEGQPLQGFSGIRALGEGRFLVLTDNGFGAEANSADALLMFHEVAVDWEAGSVEVPQTTFLSDPDAVVPFPIVNEATDTRYLTGADFDLESIQPVGEGYWLGEEFGPFVLEVDGQGVVQRIVPTDVAGQAYRSPDHPALSLPDPGGEMPADLIVDRSRGYEGMALSEDGRMLYPLLEGAVFDPESGGPLMVSGAPVAPLFILDIESGTWRDGVRYYPLEDPAHAVGDFNIIDGTRALVIERDGGQGTAEFSDTPAEFKRVYLVDLSRTDDEGVLEKIGYIDLLAIEDPEGLGRGTEDGVFTFPFVTIENVDRVDDTHIVVANDNNFPFSVGREAGRADDNEFILLEVGDFLTAE